MTLARIVLFALWLVLVVALVNLMGCGGGEEPFEREQSTDPAKAPCECKQGTP